MNFLLVMDSRGEGNEYKKWGQRLKSDFERYGATVELTDNMQDAIGSIEASEADHYDHVISGSFGNWDDYEYEKLIRVVNSRNEQEGGKRPIHFTLLTGQLTTRLWENQSQERGWGGGNFGVLFKEKITDIPETELMQSFGLPGEIQHRLPQEKR